MSSRLIRRKAANDRWGDTMARAGPYQLEVEARACPLRQLQKTHGGCGVLPYLPPEQRATLPASEDVTAVTDYSSSTPLFFGRARAPIAWPQRSLRVQNSASWNLAMGPRIQRWDPWQKPTGRAILLLRGMRTNISCRRPARRRSSRRRSLPKSIWLCANNRSTDSFTSSCVDPPHYRAQWPPV
jgi:hypothetical protein